MVTPRVKWLTKQLGNTSKDDHFLQLSNSVVVESCQMLSDGFNVISFCHSWCNDLFVFIALY